MNETFLRYNGKRVRFHGRFFRIISCRLGNAVLAQAEEHGGKEIVNLITGRSQMVMALRNSINLGLVS